MDVLAATLPEYKGRLCETPKDAVSDSDYFALEGDPVYRFLDKKRSECKPYYVYMTADANEFLCVYYSKVKECLRDLEQSK